MFCTYFTLYTGDKLPPFYIGSTKLARLDKGYHGSVLSKEYSAIWKDELKRNPSSFTTVVISEHQTRQEAFEKELELHLLVDAVNSPLYINKANAMSRFNMQGARHSEETRAKMSMSRQGLKHSEETKQKMSEARIKRLKENPYSEETRAKMSAYAKTRPMEHLTKIGTASKNRSAETLEKLSAYAKNRPMEHREKIKQASIGRVVSDETRAKQSVARKGKPKSEEWKMKIRAIHAAKKAAKEILAQSNLAE